MLVGGGAFTAQAQARASFSLEPVSAPTSRPYFVLRSAPGGTESGLIRVVNTGDTPGVASLYPVDATTGQTSGAVYLARDQPRRDVGRWLKLAAPRVSLAPGQSRNVGFQVQVPPGVGGVQHLGGIVAENAELRRGRRERSGRGRFQINVRSLTVLAVQVDVPGARAEQMSIGNVRAGGSQGGYQAVLVHLDDRSNVLLKPSISVQIKNASGTTLQNFKQKLDTFVPNTAIDFPVPVRRRALPAGDYTATIALTFAGRTIRATRKFTISGRDLRQVFGDKAPQVGGPRSSGTSYLPWILLAIVVLGAAIGIGWRRRGRPGPAQGSPQAPRGPQVPQAPVELRDDEIRLLLAELDEPGPKWLLAQVADGVVAGRGSSAAQIRERSSRDMSAEELAQWSRGIAAAARRIGIAPPFQEVEVPGFGVVYQMSPAVAQRLQDELSAPAGAR